MAVQFVEGRVAESESGFSLEEAVGEVCALEGPVVRDVCLLDAGLLADDFLSNLFSAPSSERAAAQHELMQNHSNGEEVCRICVIHSTQHFRRHIPRSPTGVRAVPGAVRPCHP